MELCAGIATGAMAETMALGALRPRWVIGLRLGDLHLGDSRMSWPGARAVTSG